MKITTTQKGVRARYCLDEFKKYMQLVSGNEIQVQTYEGESFTESADNTIRLGLLSDFTLPSEDLKDPFTEDIIDVNIKNGEGFIAGSNERSILMGVYKYFHSAGCRFLRPGKDGEYIPHCDMMHHSFTYRKKADNLFRGECCEGAISYEHMRDTVYWMPKVGMNMYMIEGLVPYNYMHKWYGHVGNTRLREKGQVTDYDFLAEKIAQLEQDILKTGIQFHDIGHGWMFEKLGIHHGSPEMEKKGLREEDKKYLALVGGKRDLMHGSTFYTHFCYSDPEARRLLVDFIVEYVQKKPFVDFLHVWLADATNNICECEQCQKTTPSDQYVQLLNEIDARLCEIGSKTRLVFILYVETVRPPALERLNNPHRFVILAAIGLHYQKGYVNEPYTGEIPPYERNNFKTPPNSLRLKWHRDWKKLCDNIPSCIFEYRFYTDQYCDPGYMQIARETYRDMKALRDVDFQGNMSDQTHRNHMPTSLPMLIMSETLFDRNIDYEKFTNDYFESAFGEQGALCREYLETLSRLFCPANLRRGGSSGVEEEGLDTKAESPKSWENNPKVYESLCRIPAVIDAFLPTIEKNMKDSDKCRARSWELLHYHAHIARSLSQAFAKGAAGDTEAGAKIFLQLLDDISGFEMEVADDFDLFLFGRYIRSKFNLPQVEYFN